MISFSFRVSGIMLFISTDNRDYQKKIDIGFAIDIVDIHRQS